jgi:mono/diheme cytochrome c family protein
VSKRSFRISRAAALLACAAALASGAPSEAEEPAKPGAPAAAADSEKKDAAAPQAGGAMTTMERVAAAEKGTLKNPFDYNDKAIVEEGRKIYLGASCNGCHGGGGGGGMCPPLTNETWVYGGDDDTLFRLITLGTDELKK